MRSYLRRLMMFQTIQIIGGMCLSLSHRCQWNCIGNLLLLSTFSGLICRSCTEKNTGAYEHGETHQGKCCHSSAGSHTQRIYQLKDLLWRLCQTDRIKFIMWMPKDHEGACY
ncbi:uncharacterized protein [Lolium perenne]|uniref:uncharacterized protein isoform X2 n=1 Tax=Lolium perenne TaxID=4522 RepID=UPI0021F6481D|nr:uncharacterized protein LOC127341085 isoform X2 [Lolium perenne]